MDKAQVSKVLKDALKGGKYSLGAKETIASMKGAKVVLCTRSVPVGIGGRLREEAKKHEVPVVDLDMTSSELSKMLGRPYRVSAVALRSMSEATLKQMLR